jgi:hypothetical protein
MIHYLTRIKNAEDIIEQVQFVSETLSEMLSLFANNINSIYHYDVLDNHSRAAPNKNESLDKENFSRFIPWYLKARLSNFTNIKFVDNELDENICVLDVCGFTAFGVHGHQDKLSDVVQNWALMIKKFPDYVFTSHFHHNAEDEVHGCEIVMNPSLIGVDDYSFKIRRTSKPAQKFMIFDDSGRECTYSINLN